MKNMKVLLTFLLVLLSLSVMTVGYAKVCVSGIIKILAPLGTTHLVQYVQPRKGSWVLKPSKVAHLSLMKFTGNVSDGFEGKIRIGFPRGSCLIVTKFPPTAYPPKKGAVSKVKFYIEGGACKKVKVYANYSGRGCQKAKRVCGHYKSQTPGCVRYFWDYFDATPKAARLVISIRK